MRWLPLVAALLCGVLRAQEAPVQPIPFSHKQHVAQGMQCTNCHAIREPGVQAGIPKEQFCMNCHASIKKNSPAIQKLADAAKAKTPLPWTRIYQLPDYVWFSHEVHVKEGKVECAACHGAVAARDALYKEGAISMAACQACHAQRKASNGCDTCHNSR